MSARRAKAQKIIAGCGRRVRPSPFKARQVGIGSLCSDFQGLFRQGVSIHGRRVSSRQRTACSVTDWCVKLRQARKVLVCPSSDWAVVVGQVRTGRGRRGGWGRNWSVLSRHDEARIGRLVEASIGLHRLVVDSLVKAGMSGRVTTGRVDACPVELGNRRRVQSGRAPIMVRNGDARHGR